MRPSGRQNNQLREVSFTRHVSKHAEGSCLVKFGDTHVLCTASLEERVPPWLKGGGKGWVTAEYGMLPRATGDRMKREAVGGKQSGRTQEIQRLIGRSLRAIVDLKALGERQITLDCDVIQADGGTRTAAITGSFIALSDCISWMMKRGMFTTSPIKDNVAAISCGIHEGVCVADLDYAEDSTAQTDANFVMTGSGGIIEIQGTAEGEPFSEDKLQELLVLAKGSIVQLVEAQKKSFGVMRKLTGQKILIATHNKGKLEEFAELLKPYGVETVSAKELRLAEPAETGTTFRDNALIKAAAGSKGSGLITISDDSGLCVDALKGAPGVYTADWAGPARDWTLAMRMVEGKLAAVNAVSPQQRKAQFCCTLCVMWPDGEVRYYDGVAPGEMVWPPRGAGGHGYDPAFKPDGKDVTFAEMSHEDKNKISHRGRAVEKLLADLL